MCMPFIIEGGTLNRLKVSFFEIYTFKKAIDQLFVGVSIAFQRHFYQSYRLLFLPLNLESFAYRHFFRTDITLQCDTKESD